MEIDHRMCFLDLEQNIFPNRQTVNIGIVQCEVQHYLFSLRVYEQSVMEVRTKIKGFPYLHLWFVKGMHDTRHLESGFLPCALKQELFGANFVHDQQVGHAHIQMRTWFVVVAELRVLDYQERGFDFNESVGVGHWILSTKLEILCFLLLRLVLVLFLIKVITVI